MSQTAARTFCAEKSSHLIEINSEAESNAINHEISRLDQEDENRAISYWLGISDRHVEGNWVFESSDENVTFTNWETDEPNNYKENEHCAFLRGDGTWNDFTCATATSEWGNGWKWAALCESTRQGNIPKVLGVMNML